ncbi:MAG TPA: hypothetical protein VLN74_06400 [Ilumatobacteraceae bacterium]|nr:hypothetical protein [Ilumatobacteraceae bacterium]
MRVTAIAAFMCVPVVFAACGDDPDATASDGVLDVSLSDFSFGDLPDEVAAGTRVEIENASETELHELVAVRLADGDDRPVDEIVASGLDEVLGAGPPAAVLLAAPGGEQIDAVGDGVFAEPGRYLLLCAIPTGADPMEYLEAAATSDGPPQVDGGPPHFVNGMVDDLVVTER